MKDFSQGALLFWHDGTAGCEPSPSPTYAISAEEIRDWGREASSLPPPVSGFKSPVSNLVGREAELARLRRCLGKALAGQRQMVFITGEPGIGKTAVVDRFLSRVSDECKRGHERELWIGRGQCVEQYGSGEAYLPVLDALSRLGRAPGGAEVVTVLAQYAPTWLAQLPSLTTGEERATLQRTLLGATRERMLREIAEALEALSCQRPLILALEDIHWSDSSTVELLAYVARRRGLARLLILGTYRPAEVVTRGHPLKEVVREVRGRTYCTELPLGRLSGVEVEIYLSNRFAGAVLPPALPAIIHSRTEGNPLFMVGVVAHLLCRGAIEQTQGQWRIEKDAIALAARIPEGLGSLIEKQFDNLQKEERRLLEVASVVGREFGAATAAAVLEQPVEVVEELCDRLASRGQFVGESGIEEWPDGTIGGCYRFLHVWYREVIYERIAEARRVQLHRRVAERKAAAYGGRVGESASELVVHCEQGRNIKQIVQDAGRAGEKAMHRSRRTLGAGYAVSAAKSKGGSPRILEVFGSADAGPVLSLAKGSDQTEVSLARYDRKCVETTAPTPNLQHAPLDPQPLTSDPQFLFRHGGEYWTVAFANSACRIKDTLGMHYLARLLRHPHQEVHVLALTGGQPVVSAQTAPSTESGGQDDLHPLLASKQRLQELQDELDEAEAFHDTGRKERLLIELETLTEALLQTAKESTCSRKAASATERARLNVTRAIRTAIRHIADVHPPLGRHLAETVKTGVLCGYQPEADTSIAWQSSPRLGDTSLPPE